MSISYSCVVLDEQSRNKLLNVLHDKIPVDWQIIAHHMTITLGPLMHPANKLLLQHMLEEMKKRWL